MNLRVVVAIEFRGDIRQRRIAKDKTSLPPGKRIGDIGACD
jgi:hypothetical protein